MHAGAGGEAAEHAERALVLARQIQARRFEAEALAFRGELHRIAGNRAAALSDIEQALAISRERPGWRMAPVFLGFLARATSDP